MGDWEEIPEDIETEQGRHRRLAADLDADCGDGPDFFAVEIGMLPRRAHVSFARFSRTTTVSPVTKDYVEDSRVHVLQGKDIPDYAIVYRIHGPFLFWRDRQVSRTFSISIDKFAAHRHPSSAKT